MPEGAENSGFLSNQTRLPRWQHQRERPKRLHHVKTGALGKQESQMVVKHRTGKPKSGISVFSGSLGASTLLFAFSFLFSFFSSSLQLIAWFWVCVRRLTFVTQAGLELKALLKPLQLGHSLVTTPALKSLPSPIGEEGWVEGPSYPRLALGLLSS